MGVSSLEQVLKKPLASQRGAFFVSAGERKAGRRHWQTQTLLNYHYEKVIVNIGSLLAGAAEEEKEGFDLLTGEGVAAGLVVEAGEWVRRTCPSDPFSDPWGDFWVKVGISFLYHILFFFNLVNRKRVKVE